MITGAHSIVYSARPEEDRAFFKDVLKLPFVDVGHGWLIFSLPPAEVAVHPSTAGGGHELYLMCEDITAFVRAMDTQGIAHSPVDTVAWGILTRITLPSGGTVGVYQPRHVRAAGDAD